MIDDQFGDSTTLHSYQGLYYSSRGIPIKQPGFNGMMQGFRLRVVFFTVLVPSKAQWLVVSNFQNWINLQMALKIRDAQELIVQFSLFVSEVDASSVIYALGN